ncbi:MAG: type VI secretion system-associated protein TagF [Cellvibrionaceae bacterium]|nr:type VI secretion system-associated protein TagF [Cellvibrionaceae bacterium]
MSADQKRCGLFGKAPQKSDFICHNLPESFTEYWHAWLQSSLSISQEQLGGQWLGHYLISPIWHFAIMPSIAYKQAVVGVMIPSVDEVGRYFPITIAHMGNYNVWSAYLQGEYWYKDIEKVALMTLADEVTYNTLIAELEALPIPELDPLPDYQTVSAPHAYKGNQHFEQTKGMTNSDLAVSLLPKLYDQQLGRHSLWWTKGSETVPSCLAVSNNIPDPGQFAAMLDGQWLHWGWVEEHIKENKQ